MENYARLILKTNTNYLPTNLPAQFFGMPDNSVIIVYARFYSIKFEDTGLEFVFARHSEFKFDYKTGKIFYFGNKAEFFIPDEMIDKPDPKFEILDVYRNIDSFSKAAEYLNKKAEKMLSKNTHSKKKVKSANE
ncbi:hypothetical protein [Draconibacterium orientale]|uniref:hypothetical protein n=1 Tax=Draconibacterium orientale TaxID=1168034 RepID=UPI0029BFD2C2|nr:hypothetical protein [Draconibacterium orientale]